MSVSSMSREQWIEVFEASGLDEAMMQRWHGEFERRYPAQHQAFLEWIGFTADEAMRVRQSAPRG